MAAVAPDTLAWLFYTSGTTGKPKGAMLSHRNLVFMCEAYYSDLGYPSSGDTQLHAAPLSHGAGMYALPHLLAGGRQQILAQFDPQAVIEALALYQGVSFFAAPTMVMRLVNYPDAHPSLFTHLKFIVYGGAPMYVADLKKALSLFGPRLYQLYGQGEAPMTITGLSQANHMTADFQEREARLASCGYPRKGVEVAVFDAEGNALPSGVVGEIVTRSPCVMQGYWNNPEATRDALQDGWLYTGDIGSMRDDGLLTLQDRSKDLIISGGSNVYPREIEEVLLRHPGVRECALVGKPDSEWGELPVAFIVPATKPAPTIAELESLVLDHLARFKRPRVWIFVDSLPKNNYGKVLKTALRRELAKWDS
jgi:acyl-CoA synthetase (AMP-forming)/AMP-acid ligase II